MKLSAFKKGLLLRYRLFKASSRFAFQGELAYSANNWGSLFSTTAYTITTIIFTHLIYGQTKLIAGYSINQMLLFLFMSQMTYYLNWYVSIQNLEEMIYEVNKGFLDLILIKPIPTLFYVTFRNLGGYSLLVQALPPMIGLTLAIDWSSLHFTLLNFFFGSVIFICGLICIHTVQLVASLPVFWLGESSSLLDLASFIGLGGGVRLPLEGHPKELRLVLSTIIPVLFASGFATSAFLNKSNPPLLFFWTLFITIFALVIRRYAWQLAIKNYTSASS